MFRLIRTLILMVGAICAGLVGIGLLIGQVTPAGKQVIFTEPRPDQWTKVSLVTLDRNLSANRYLPVRVNSAQWSAEGERLMVMGARNSRPRMYMLGYSEANNRQDWLASISRQAAYGPYTIYSPDMRWFVVMTMREDDFEIKLRPLDSGKIFELLDPPPTQGFDQQSQWIMGQSFWTSDSKRFIYSKVKIDNRSHLMPVAPQTVYYIMDAETGEERLLLENGNIYELQMSPDGTHLFYSTSREITLPSQNPNDYQPGYTYYIHNLQTGQEFKISDTAIYQVIWSPDGKKLLYMQPSARTEVQVPDSVFDRMLRQALPWYYGFNSYNHFGGYTSPIGMGNFSIPFSRLMGESSERTNAYLVDTETGAKQPLPTDQFGSNYNMQWLPDNSGILFSVQWMGIQEIVSQVLRIPYMYGAAPVRTETYVWRFGEESPQLLEYEGEALVMLSIAPKGDQVLLGTINTQSPRFQSVQPLKIYRYQTTSGEITPIDLQNDQYMYATFSPNGEAVVLTTQTTPYSQNVPAYPTAPPSSLPTIVSGAPLPTIAPFVTPMPPFTPSGVPILTLGSAVPAPVPTFRIYLLEGDKPEPRYIASTVEPNMLFWSPDGKSAMYFDGQMSGQSVLYLIEDITSPNAAPRPIFTPKTRIHVYSYGSFPIWRPDGDDLYVSQVPRKG